MNIKEFLNTEIARLPKKRDDKESFLDFLRRTLNKFSEEISKIEGVDSLTIKVLEQQVAIKELSDVIIKAVEEYYNGHPCRATKCLFDWFSKNQKLINHLQAIGMEKEEFDRKYLLYRMRVRSDKEFSRSEMFHIPFEKRHIVKTQRYSIPGCPCLYLGGSTYTCWKEMHRPTLDELEFVRLMPTRKLKLLDLAYIPTILLEHISTFEQTQQTEFFEFVIAHIVLWPLKCACMIQTLYDDAPFKAEYIIPQLLLEYARSVETIDGIRHYSVHIEQPEKFFFQGVNYAIPVKTEAASGLCEKLKGLFYMTEVMSWQLLRETNIFPSSIRETNFDNAVVELVTGEPQLYEQTTFGRMDTYGLRIDAKPL
jgi:hypothetical protein